MYTIFPHQPFPCSPFVIRGRPRLGQSHISPPILSPQEKHLSHDRGLVGGLGERGGGTAGRGGGDLRRSGRGGGDRGGGRGPWGRGFVGRTIRTLLATACDRFFCWFPLEEMETRYEENIKRFASSKTGMTTKRFLV